MFTLSQDVDAKIGVIQKSSIASRRYDLVALMVSMTFTLAFPDACSHGDVVLIEKNRKQI